MNFQKYIQAIKKGKLVIIPTETVYGLAGNALDPKAIKNIFEAKRRPQDNPLIVHLANSSQIKKYTIRTPKYFDKLSKKFSPGPLTYVLEKNHIIPDIVTTGLKSVAIRIPNHNLTLRFLKELNLPIAAPSANISGKPSPTKLIHALEDFQDNELVFGGFDGGQCEIGIESTVIKCLENEIIILRKGDINKEDLEKEINIKVSYAKSNSIAESPGLKHRHYAPNIPLMITKNPKLGDNNILVLSKEGLSGSKKFNSKNLFDELRNADKRGYKEIQIIETENLINDLALYDRILRASGESK